MKRGLALFNNTRNYFLSTGRNIQSKDPGMNPLFAIDTETTGLDFEKDEIIEICILPLNCDSTINKMHKPFNLYIKPSGPKMPEWPQFMKRNYDRAMQIGCTRGECIESFITWHTAMNLENMKMAPVGHNYVGFDKNFIKKQLFPTMYEELFDYHVYDTMSCANLHVLQSNRKGTPPLFRGVSLSKVAAGLGIVTDPATEHTAYGDCVTTAAVLNHFICKL